MSSLGWATISVIPSAAGFGTALGRQVDPELAAAGHTSGLSFGKILGVAGIAAFATAIVGIGAVLKTGFDEAKDASAGIAQLNAGIASTGGVAHTTVKGMTDLASSIQSYSGQTDDSIVASEQLLLTFTNIRNTPTAPIFDQATEATANMAAKMGGDASDKAILLGKALNDPIKGMTALQRVGVQFTDAQKATIKSMVETGDIAGAQKVILAELQVEFGGAARAAGQSLPGQLARAKRAFEDVSQSVVEGILPIVTPALQGIASVLTTKVVPAITGFIQGFKDGEGAGGRFRDVLSRIGAVAGPIIAEVGGGIRAMVAAFQAGGSDVTSSGFAGVLERVGLAGRVLADFVAQYLWPALKSIGNVLFDVAKVYYSTLFDAFRGIVSALVSIVEVGGKVLSFFKEHKDVAIVLGTFLAAVFVPALVSAAAAWVWSTVVMGTYNLVMRGIMVASAAWTVIQNALNASLWANPVGAVILAIIALVAAVVLAYRHSDQFRQIVQATWQGIKTAALVAWTSVIKPVFDGFMAGLRFTGEAALWLWHNAIQPAFNAIGIVASFVWNSILKPTLDGFMTGMRFVGTVAMWLWHNVIEPGFQAIGAIISFAWNNVIKPIFDAWRFIIMDVLVPVIMWLWHNVVEPAFRVIADVIKVAWWGIRVIFDLWRAFIMDVLVPVILWLWHNVVEPAFNAIGSIISFVWNNIIKPVFEVLKAALGLVGDAFSWVWNNVVKPVWTALGDGISWVWNYIVKPSWTALKIELGMIGDAFKWVWDKVIKPVWDALGNGIAWVYDNVIKPVWDRLTAAISVVGDFFHNVVGGIKDKWDELRDAISKPIHVVIDFLSDKLGGAWNAVKKILPVLPDFPKLAGGGSPGEGGVLRGPGTGTSDGILGMNYFTGMPTAHVANGEFVVRESAYQQHKGLVEGINAGLPREQLQYLASGGLAGLPRLADGGATWPAMLGIIKGQFPWALDNSDYRPGDPGYHGKGQALDIGAPGNDRSRLSEANQWLGNSFAGSTEVIYLGGINIKNGQNVGDGMGVYGPDTMAEHGTHIHWANDRDPNLNKGGGPGFLGQIWNGVKGVSHFLREQAVRIFDLAMTPVSGLVDHLLPSDGPGFNKLPKGVFDTVRDAARAFIIGKADGADAASGGAGQAVANFGDNVDIMRRTAAQFGWGDGAEWDALYRLEMKEAGFNNLAQNPVSTAYGMGQFLDSTWAPYGPKTSDASLQALYMMRYLGDHGYGDPITALAFHDANNWYDDGGIAAGAGWLPKNNPEPERVLAPSQTAAFEQMVAANFSPTSGVAQAAQPTIVAGIHVEAGAHFHTNDEAETLRRSRNEAARLAAAL